MQNINLTNKDKEILSYRINTYLEYFIGQSEIAFKMMKLKYKFMKIQNPEEQSWDDKNSKIMNLKKWISNSDNPNINTSDRDKVTYMYFNLWNNNPLSVAGDCFFDYNDTNNTHAKRLNGVRKRMNENCLKHISNIITNYLKNEYTERLKEVISIDNFINLKSLIKEPKLIFRMIQKWWNHITQHQDIKLYSKQWNRIIAKKSQCNMISRYNSFYNRFLSNIGEIKKRGKRVIHFESDPYSNGIDMINTLLIYLSRSLGYESKQNLFKYENLKQGMNNYEYGIIEKIRWNKNNSFAITFYNDKDIDKIIDAVNQSKMKAA